MTKGVREISVQNQKNVEDEETNRLESIHYHVSYQHLKNHALRGGTKQFV